MSNKWAQTKSTVEAWSPAEVQAQKINFIPPEIIEAVNELLARNWNGYSATVRINELAVNAASRMQANDSPNLGKSFAQEGWLDFEPIFESKGWKVEFDRPGYCENYEASWRFRLKQV